MKDHEASHEPAEIGDRGNHSLSGENVLAEWSRDAKRNQHANQDAESIVTSVTTPL